MLFKKITRIVLGIATITLASTSCASLKVPEGYLIDESALKDSLALNEHNIVLFWTNWCRGSHYRIDSLYTPLAKEISRQGLNLKIYLIASDANISLSQVDELRKRGFSTYFMDHPGGMAIANRLAIKKFINNAFPDNEVERIKGIQFGIPVELLITKQLKIINEKETRKSFDFIKEIIG